MHKLFWYLLTFPNILSEKSRFAAAYLKHSTFWEHMNINQNHWDTFWFMFHISRHHILCFCLKKETSWNPTDQ